MRSRPHRPTPPPRRADLARAPDTSSTGVARDGAGLGVTFLWPNVVTIEAVLTDVEFRYMQFAGDGSPLVYTAEVSFEEVLDVRVTSEERRAER